MSGSARALRDAHLSDDEAIAKMGHPELWWAARDSRLRLMDWKSRGESTGNGYVGRMRRFFSWVYYVGLVAVATAGMGAWGQQGGPRFEVVVIRPTAPDATNWKREFNPGLMNVENQSLRNLIEFAYGLKSDLQLLNAPAWASTLHFDIRGKEDPELAKKLETVPLAERVKLMQELMRSVLQERFHLEVHEKTLQVPVFALTLAKDGPKFKKANAADGRTFRGLVGPAGRIDARGATMQLLADRLAGFPEAAGRPVLDKTGLQGEYDWSLRWAPEGRTVAAADEDMLPGLFTALQEQLGLKFESQKGEVPGVVVDRVEKPTEN